MRFGIVLVLFLLSSCAQVGVLGGGAKDEFAPKPDMDKMVPKNATTSFNGKEIIIPFDEFIKLKNPSETIIVVPPNIKPIAKIKKKSLVLSWEEDLSPNTTYAFYLNGTVQDTKESNDSLMTFVFSTGTYIDSLTAQFLVRDAFTNEPQKGFIVGLYEQFSDTIRPTYFTQTDAKGMATLSYLKAGKYDVAAFFDKSKDLKHQADEPFAYKNDALLLTENTTDSVPMRSYTPQQKPKITSLKFNPPGSFIIASNRSLENASFNINDVSVSADKAVYFKSDSLLIPFETSDTSLYTLIVNSTSWTDTSSLRVTQKEKKQTISLSFEKTNTILPKLPISLISSSEINSLVAPLILVEDAKDSSKLIIRSLNSLGSRIEMNFDRENVSSANLIFLPGAIVGLNGANADTLKLKIICLSSKEVGNLDVDISEFSESVILEILLGKQLIESVPMNKSQRKHQFINLKPGEYSFRFIYDENENGRWDVGNRDMKIQPEFVEVFTETQKVRANWDLEVVLKKAENGDTE
jgi:uncharacterized protein (DUF2141 family)|tara:strand:- start:12582 stop:14147 length:1566 start_codon:yes stop_codon:yes gene_type:complete